MFQKLLSLVKKIDAYKASLNYVQDKKNSKGTLFGGFYTIFLIL